MQTKLRNNALIVLGVIAILLAVVAIYYSAVYLPQKQAALSSLAQEKQQCATQGSQYAAQYRLDPNNVPSDAYWFAPEYHFSTQMSTCLVAMHFTWNTFDPLDKGLYDDESIIVDTSSNKTILYSWLDINPTASTTKLVTYLPPDSGPNVDASDFQIKKAELFSQ